MSKKHKIKRAQREKSPLNTEQIKSEKTYELDEIDESIAHQLSIEEVLKQRKVVFELDEEEQVKIAPCVILSAAGADTEIKVGGGFDLSAAAQRLKDGFALLASRKSRNSSRRKSGSKKRTSLSPESIEKGASGGGSNNDNNKNKRNNNKNNNQNNNNKNIGSEGSKASKAAESGKSVNNVIDIKGRLKGSNIMSNKLIGNIPAGYFFAAGIIIILLVIIFALTHKNAQQVYVGDKLIGVVNEKNITGEQLKADAVAKLSTEKGVSIQVNEDVTLKAVHASKKDISNVDYMLTQICDNFTYQVGAAAIKVDGVRIGIAENEEAAQEILDAVKNQVTDKIKASNPDADIEFSQVEFVQQVDIEESFVTNNEIETNETIVSKLTATTNEQREHTVEAGDTLSSIAGNADMTLAELYQANPGLDENSVLQIGQVIQLTVPVPVLSVRTVETETREEEFYADTIYVDNNDEYKTYEKTISEGTPGKRRVTTEITKVNGVEESRTDSQQEILTEAVAKKVERGTLQTPPKKAIGSFIYPVSGRLSSGFGARGGKAHKGIDLASAKGTPVYASDGGTVKFAGWNSGGYGYLVIIDHGNGYETYYGHNSQVAVSAGEKVYQGQLIAYVGSTGDSTGNHLHFEIRKNGVPENPLNYIG